MPELRGERVVLRPVEEADTALLLEIHRRPEVLRWWGEPDDGFPMTDEPGTARFAICHDDRIVGMVQFGEETDPDYRSAWIDIYLDPDVHDRGLGSDAVRTLADHIFEHHGHHRITIDPAAANTRAVRAYEKAGFRPVGVQQAAWRNPAGEWVDVLLMEMVRLPTSESRRSSTRPSG